MDDTKALADRLDRCLQTVRAKAHSMGLKKAAGIRGARREVGSFGVGSNGYLNKKVRADGPPQSRFVTVHRLVWIEQHGPVPEGFVVAFKKGMRTSVLEEITIDRLECITHSEIPGRKSCS